MRRSDAGFSLLEVLIAIAILATALLVIMHAQDDGVLVSQYENQQITAATLARWKMVDLQLRLEKDGFPDEDKEDCGKFSEEIEDSGFDDYSYCYQIKKVELPLPMDMLGGGDKDSSGGGSGGQNPQGGAASALGIDPKTASEQLSKAVRVLKLTIKWKLGNTEQQLPVVTHLVNMSQTQVVP